MAEFIPVVLVYGVSAELMALFICVVVLYGDKAALVMYALPNTQF